MNKPIKIKFAPGVYPFQCEVEQKMSEKKITKLNKIMKLNQIQVGQFFTIDNTPTYPKLRTDYGYIDVRDGIKKECEDLPWDLEIMTNERVFEEAKKGGLEEMKELEELKKRLLSL